MMTKHTQTIAMVFVALLIGGAAAYASMRGSGIVQAPAPSENGHACTMEAKICPDGSAVGRTGPNCEFAVCPGSTDSPVTPMTKTVHIGETVSMMGLEAKVVSVADDSRCPATVQCVWAGTVKVNIVATYGMLSKDVVLELGVPYELGGHSVTLTAVSPEKTATGTIPSSLYAFTFSIQ